jgi:ATP-dependent RNA helicase DDX31/DBP7
MADDGLLLNFEVGKVAAVGLSSNQYKGRWKEKAKAKKWDRIKARRVLNGQPVSIPAPREERPKQNTNGDEGKQTNTTDSSHPLKRKRNHPASSANATPVIPRKSTSSLFTGNPDIAPIPKEVTVTSTTATNAPLLDSSEFTSLGIDPVICSHLSKSLDITTPTQIQQLTIPHLLTSTKDTFLRAQTGSGKTLAFILPILHTLLSLSTEHDKYDRTSGCFAIILTPTRELAKQIEAVLTLLTAGTWIVPGWILGGERKKSEKARLRKGVNILVATPGRLADHLDTTMAFDTSFVRWIVLDEGDRLVDMGFLETVGKILRVVEGRVQHRITKAQKDGRMESKLPARLVKVLCSATLRGEEGLGALETIVEPVFLKAETETDLEAEDIDHVFTPSQLTQSVVILPAKLRFVMLSAILASFGRRAAPAKMIIFFSCATSVDFHHQLLSSFELDMHIFQLHGQLDQPVRTATLKTFSATKSRAILLATDVASRGLDLPSVDMVVQFDPPVSQDDYIHRIGRTARAGRKGEGILFLLPSEEDYVASLTSHGSQIERVAFEDILKKAFGKEWMNESTTRQLQAEKWILEDQQVYHAQRC